MRQDSYRLALFQSAFISEARAFLPKPSSDHVTPSSDLAQHPSPAPQGPLHPALCLPRRFLDSSGARTLQIPESSCLLMLPGPGHTPHICLSALPPRPHLAAWSTFSDSDQVPSSLAAPHAGSGLAYTLLSPAEVCFLPALSSRHAPGGQGAGTHLSPDPRAWHTVRQSRCSINACLTASCVKWVLGSLSSGPLPPCPTGSWLVLPVTSPYLIAIPTGPVLCTCAHSVPARMTVRGWTSQRKVRGKGWGSVLGQEPGGEGSKERNDLQEMKAPLGSL